ncbi:MAG: HAMP domain-containing histidine kinase, partial [Breznakibacter sp.]|nr:HAMP domain-containing histidine kinase [Breznakibacter sp.]
VLDDVIQLLGNNYKFKNIEINKLFNVDIKGVGDIQMVKTLFRNILSNAIKFTPIGGRIDIYAYENEERLLISFKDDGIGIKPDKLPRLFQLELEISTLGTNLESGSGLGLVLCKDLVEKHNGRIWVESDGKKGTEFFIELPLKKSLLKRHSKG